ncbi:cobalt-precorrin 5A hydrolase [Maledivibacter halophilus]|uniref:Cobalt-precorrin 5A acetaldehyde-lyase n=1 Tax=Maledivibacter halophilus TaxID=36842 RepID=A0A1T5LI12_9FIRM|nr:cobalt-precorrin 5A hydrolase [Maledivibacter halophilus]SKC75621.1 cobalt-precorrin 5A acetaldehyde-lyase [Maledivibacter halophilus]
MNKAIITLTKGGIKLGLKLLDQYEDSVLYVNRKFDINHERVKKIEEGINKLTGAIFQQYECLIFIMATGIVVRAIASYLKNKALDPAVVVMDEKGKNIISLLSGHLGGANEITLDIAKKLNGNPVITTASDINNTLAVDTLAMKTGCAIENLKDATKVTAHIVNKEIVGIVSKIHLNINLPDNMILLDNNKTTDGFKGIIIITNKKIITRSLIDTVVLRPKNIIIGVGCKKGKTREEIVEAISVSLDKIERSHLSIKHIATIDVKRNEKGIVDAANYYNVPLVIIEREKVLKIEKKFEASDFVKRTIGVGAVAEPVSVLSSNEGRLIMKKTKYNGITIAIAEEGGA